MNGREDDGPGGPGQPVGSVGEEAAKLLDALQGWAEERGASGGPGGSLGDHWRSVNEHLATGGEDCTYCPVCQVIHRAREASPELRAHLAVATSSLLQAAATLLDARAHRAPGAEPQVTKIDLDDDSESTGS